MYRRPYWVMIEQCSQNPVNLAFLSREEPSDADYAEYDIHCVDCFSECMRLVRGVEDGTYPKSVIGVLEKADPIYIIEDWPDESRTEEARRVLSALRDVMHEDELVLELAALDELDAAELEVLCCDLPKDRGAARVLRCLKSFEV